MSRVFSLAAAAFLYLGLDGCETRSIPLTSRRPAPILLFNGTGTSPNDVAAFETLLHEYHLGYSIADSAQLNDMSAARLSAYRLLIVPGGDFEIIGKNLTPATAAKIHDAVHGSLNYLGICAGAFLAGNLRDNGFNLTSGVRFGFYSAEGKGIRKATVAIAGVGTPTLDQYWEDGPELSGWGAVVGRYPDGSPAIVEDNFGNGQVVLSGVHPEAPLSWRRGMTFETPVSVDRSYAADLIQAALNQRWLPHEELSVPTSAQRLLEPGPPRSELTDR